MELILFPIQEREKDVVFDKSFIDNLCLLDTLFYLSPVKIN